MHDADSRKSRVIPFLRRPARRTVGEGDVFEASAHTAWSGIAGVELAVVRLLDGLTPETIPTMEIATGVPLVYRLKADTTVDDKKVLA